MQVRNVSLLRRLVLRYAKALYLLGWTVLVSFFAVAAAKISDPNTAWQVIGASFVIWAALGGFVVRRPMTWLRKEHEVKEVVFDAYIN